MVYFGGACRKAFCLVVAVLFIDTTTEFINTGQRMITKVVDADLEG